MRTIHQYLYVTLCFLITAAFGYYLQALRDQPPSARDRGISLDYFMPVQSFSEIENARAVLHALAARSLQELRHRRIAVGRPELGTRGVDLVRDEKVERLIQEFHLAIHEFRGTGHEWLFVQDLLWLLKNERRHEEWVTAYLQALYRHPTHEMIGRLAPEAVRIAQVAHRENDVLEAIDLLRGFPGSFAQNRPPDLTGQRGAGHSFLVRNESTE